MAKIQNFDSFWGCIPTFLHIYRGYVSPLRGEKPIFGPLSKNNTGMAALRAGLPLIIFTPVHIQTVVFLLFTDLDSLSTQIAALQFQCFICGYNEMVLFFVTLQKIFYEDMDDVVCQFLLCELYCLFLLLEDIASVVNLLILPAVQIDYYVELFHEQFARLSSSATLCVLNANVNSECDSDPLP